MNSRERILAAISHQEPDRLPITKPNIIPTNEPLSVEMQQLIDTFDFDNIVAVGNTTNNPGRRHKVSDNTVEDAYGCRFKDMGVGNPYCVYSPLAEANSIDDVERFKWPSAKPVVSADLRDKAQALRKEGKYATGVHIDTLFHRYQYMRGFEQWLIDLKTDPELHKAIADHIHSINMAHVMAVLEEVGEFTDIVTGSDDLGTSLATFMSPQDFRTYLKPYYKDLISQIKQRFAHIKFYLHSHGQIMDIVPDLIECGVDVLNPILPLDNMNASVLKREYGKQLCFEGGVDIEHILPFGDFADVEPHVIDVINTLKPGGGFIFRAQAISPLISFEKLALTYRLAREYGRYR